MIPTTAISSPYIMGDAPSNLRHCADSALGIGDVISYPPPKQKYGDTILRIDKIMLENATIGYVYITADYNWFIGGKSVTAGNEGALQGLFGLNETLFNENRNAIGEGLFWEAVPVDYNPGHGLTREPCINADFQGHL